MPAASKTSKVSRDRILSTAVTMADKNGIAALSMRKLGEALGIEAMSLYNHIADKEDLLDGMVDLIFSEIDLPPASGIDWKPAMRHRALSARDVFSAHPWAIGLIDSHSFPGPATLKHFDDIMRCLRTAGFSVDMTAHAHNVIYSYVYGFILLFDQDPHFDRARKIIKRIPSDQYPYAIEMTSEYKLRPGFDRNKEFEAGLDLILDSLEGALGRQTFPGANSSVKLLRKSSKTTTTKR